jgi:hypothetical protein
MIDPLALQTASYFLAAFGVTMLLLTMPNYDEHSKADVIKAKTGIRTLVLAIIFFIVALFL